MNRKCEPRDVFMVFTNITTGFVSQYYINLLLVFPSTYKGQSEVIRRKDFNSNSQWHHDIFMYTCVCVCVKNTQSMEHSIAKDSIGC